MSTGTAADTLTVDRVGRILDARNLDDLSVCGSVILEAIELDLTFLTGAEALTGLRHVASASRARTRELYDLHEDKWAVTS